jgi:hypothetical protein
VTGFLGQGGTFFVQSVSIVFQGIIQLGNAGGTEGVGFDHIRTGFKVEFVDVVDCLRFSQSQQVVVSAQILDPVLELLA